MGREYKRAVDFAAFVHMMTFIARSRDEMLARLVTSEDAGGKYREAIILADSLLRLPDKMARDGKASEKALAEMEGRNG